MFRLIFLVYFSIFSSLSKGDEECRKNDELIREKLSGIADNKPQTAQVEIGVRLKRISFDPSAPAELTLDGFLLTSFHDERLVYNDSNPCHEYVLISAPDFESHIKSPNLTLVNGVMYMKNGIASPTMVYANGTVVETKRLEVKAPCTATDHSSPYGNITCKLIWHNEQFTQDELKTMWEVELSKLKSLTGKDLKSDLNKHSSTGNLIIAGIDFDHNVITLPNGLYDELIMDIRLSQSPNRLLLLFYLPSILIVMISWFSMVLGPMAITRAILIIGSLILLVIHYATFDTPVMNHITAIDVWKIVTIIFVVIALLELVIVSCLASTGRSRRLLCCRPKKKKGVNYYTFEPIYEELNDLRNRRTRHTCSCCRYTALCLDITSVLTFAAGFALFVFFYVYHNQEMAKYFNDFRMHVLKNHD